MMHAKCNPENVGPTVKAVQNLFSAGNVIVDKVVMSELSFLALFGEDKTTKAHRQKEICGVPIRLDDSADKYALVCLGTNEKPKAKKKTDDKTEKPSK